MTTGAVEPSKRLRILTKPVVYWFAGGVCVLESSSKTGRTQLYRGPDMGGGVGGINYSCKADGSDLNYKHYNLRGDVIVTTDSAGSVLSQSQYEAYGEHIDFGTMPTDKYRANTKVEDSETNLLLEGHRYRHLEYKVFMSPDPLEYVDGYNFYAYCGYNPWGRFDPTGLNSYLAVWFSKISYDENGNHYFDVGHAGYAVDNYRKESYTENVNGRTVNKTRMVPDGTVTYYDKWPFNSVDESDYANDVRADYSKGVVMSKDDFINMDPTGNREGNVSPEGRPADGIMEFNRTYSQDQSSKQYAEGEIKRNTDYNGTFDQCSNFAQNGINSGARYGIDKINGRESIPIVGAILTPRVVTPNSLYNSALRGNNTRRIRGPETPVKSSYEVYRTKNDQISKNKTDKDDQ